MFVLDVITEALEHFVFKDTTSKTLHCKKLPHFSDQFTETTKGPLLGPSSQILKLVQMMFMSRTVTVP